MDFSAQRAAITKPFLRQALPAGAPPLTAGSSYLHRFRYLRQSELIPWIKFQADDLR
jgi:hypothetical protein